MRGLVCLKIERPFIFHDVVQTMVRQRLVTDWWAIVTRDQVLQRLGSLAGSYQRVLSLTEHLALGGEPSTADLQDLQDRYGDPTLWSGVVADRRLYTLDPSVYAHNPSFRGFSLEEIQRLVGRAFRAAERVLAELDPQIVLLESCASIDEYALYRVAASRGIATPFVHHSRVRNRWFVSEDPRALSPEIPQLARELRAGLAAPPTDEESRFADDVLEGLRVRHEAPASQGAAMEWISSRAAVRASRVLRFPFVVAKAVLDPPPDAADNPYVPRPWRAASERVGLRMRMVRDTRLTRWEMPPGGEDYLYYPLQMQPEVTTSLWSPGHQDQVGIVEALARSVPLTWRVYVKEHPVMMGCRPGSFYRRLREIPNVRLIDPRLSSHALIHAARLVASVTGTALWEAAALGTPAIQFGRTVFTGCRGVAYFERGLDALPGFVAEVIRGELLEGEFDVRDYLIAVLRSSFPGDTIVFSERPGCCDPQEIEAVVGAMAGRIRRSPGDSG